MENKNFNRRQFLSCGAMIGAAGMVAPAILSSCGGGAKEETGYTPLKAPGEYYVPELPDKAIMSPRRTFSRFFTFAFCR